MITLIATILAFGIVSTIEEFHVRLNPFHDLKNKLPNGNGNRLEEDE
jgi:hypothetical protein